MALTALKQPKPLRSLTPVSVWRFRVLISKPYLPLNLCELHNSEIPFLSRHQTVLSYFTIQGTAELSKKGTSLWLFPGRAPLHPVGQVVLEEWRLHFFS